MTNGMEYVFQNGSSSSLFSWIGNKNLTDNSTLYVQTNDESMVGTQRLVLRGCDNNNNLLEINFYVNVSSNSAPEFNTDIQTQWAMNVNDKVPYKLPSWSDPEASDPGQVYINSMENQDFPPFIAFDNFTNTITMYPNSTKYQGRTYYFSVVLKEKNSDFMMNIYYMTVKINGDPVDSTA